MRLGPVELPLASEAAGADGPRRVQILFRPEDVDLSPQPDREPPRLGLGVVEAQSFVGAFERLRLRLPPLAEVRAVAPAPGFGAGELMVEAVRPQHEAVRFPLAAGDTAWVGVRRFHVLAPASLRRQLLGVARFGLPRHRRATLPGGLRDGLDLSLELRGALTRSGRRAASACDGRRAALLATILANRAAVNSPLSRSMTITS